MSRNVHQFVRLSLVVLVAVILSFSSGERARFDNYRVYKVNADTETELVFLRSLDGSSDSLIFLDAIHSTGKDVHVVVAPHKVPDFLEALATNEIMYELVESNFQNVLEMDETPATETRATETEYNWKSYQQLDDTYDWMVTLARENPNVVTLIEGGKSYQRRSILGVKISFKNEKKEKPGIFVEAGMHAREWIGPATATYIINQLLTSEDDAIKNLAQNFNWFVFPHTNPDGYVYTHTKNRLWRKTRTPYPRGCYGADPNRNWDFHWNEIGASSNPCSDTYAGPSAFSEIETETLSKYITSLGDQIHLYLSLHSYSQLLLYPFAGISALPENVDNYRQVANATIDAISKLFGTKYTGGNTYDAIYPAAGSTIDWAYANAGIKMSFCFELRPSKSNFLTGFRLPPSQIIPTGEETLYGIGAMIGEAKKLGYFN